MPRGLVPHRISRELWLRESQSYVVGAPGSIGMAKLWFQNLCAAKMSICSHIDQRNWTPVSIFSNIKLVVCSIF